MLRGMLKQWESAPGKTKSLEEGGCEQEMDGDGAGGDRMGLSDMGDEDVDLEAEGQSGLRHSRLCPLWWSRMALGAESEGPFTFSLPDPGQRQKQ